MMPKRSDYAEKFGMEVLRQLLNKTQGEKFFRVDFGERTQVLEYVQPDPFVLEFDALDGRLVLDKFLEPVATSLLLKIREGSFEKICDLPAPDGDPHTYYNWRDPESNLAVRAFRFFEFQSGRMFTKFEIGVES